MSIEELKAKDEAGLKQEVQDLLKEQFNLRMQKGSGQLSQFHLLKKVRRNIARAKTVLKQKEGGAS